jgi:hypothetical protein
MQDGSWHVRKRALPTQPYFESGFPNGVDQYISAAATNWATEEDECRTVPLARINGVAHDRWPLFFPHPMVVLQASDQVSH